MDLNQPLQQPPPDAAVNNRVHPLIWREIAGCVSPYTVNSKVYYFPQGHFEHFNLHTENQQVISKPAVLCRISTVTYHADHITDEVYAKLVLVPIDRSSSYTGGQVDVEADNNHDDDDHVTSHAKVLTQSDANNGGGFSVPKVCATTIFPALNYEDDRPVQTLNMRDLRGVNWEFKHIYRGNPLRHLFTTGWSDFVNGKRLVSGDSVVFMNRRDELYVGIRRGSENSFSKEGVQAETVVEAAERAENGLEFEVVWYPKAMRVSFDFVVEAEKVERAMGIHWTTGLKVKISVQNLQESDTKWFEGTVVRVVSLFPWRAIQVAWNEYHEVLTNANRVSPWQLEVMVVDPYIPNLVFHETFAIENSWSSFQSHYRHYFPPWAGISNVYERGESSRVASNGDMAQPLLPIMRSDINDLNLNRDIDDQGDSLEAESNEHESNEPTDGDFCSIKLFGVMIQRGSK